MINGSPQIVREGELLFIPSPHRGKVALRVVVQMVNPSDNQTVDADKPPASESASASSGNDRSEVGDKKSLRGVHEGVPIQ